MAEALASACSPTYKFSIIEASAILDSTNKELIKKLIHLTEQDDQNARQAPSFRAGKDSADGKAVPALCHWQFSSFKLFSTIENNEFSESADPI